MLSKKLTKDIIVTSKVLIDKSKFKKKYISISVITYFLYHVLIVKKSSKKVLNDEMSIPKCFKSPFFDRFHRETSSEALR